MSESMSFCWNLLDQQMKSWQWHESRICQLSRLIERECDEYRSKDAWAYESGKGFWWYDVVGMEHG